MKLWIIIALCCVLLAVLLFVVPGFLGARTIYEGSVEIEPVSLEELQVRLEEHGCRGPNSTVHDLNGTTRCVFDVVENGLRISPHGLGFGPVSFILNSTALSAQKDIPGIPRMKKYQEEVRADVVLIGSVVTLKEDTWELTKTTYPFTAVY